MATDRTALFAVPAAAALLLWPALWNGYPIVFADTGTYLSQAINHYAGWDRPVFYSLFMLPLHLTLTVWPVVVAQALLAAWVMWRVVQVLVPGASGRVFVLGVGVLAVGTWLPWLVSELMPDLFTPLLVLVLCLLACVPARLSLYEQGGLVGLAAFLIATQQSSLPLALVLPVVLIFFRVRPVVAGSPFRAWTTGPIVVGWPPVATWPTRRQAWAIAEPGGGQISQRRRWLLAGLPAVLAVLGLCSVNLAAHGRFAVSPFGNVFFLARVIYDGPGMTVLRRDCPGAGWRLCPFVDSLPATSDDFLWAADSPLYRAGGPKVVSADAGAIIAAALVADPLGEAWAAGGNMLEQIVRFDSGDGLMAWPDQVSGWIERDFPVREQAAYAAARQQAGGLAVPSVLSSVHTIAGVGGVVACLVLLPVAFRRRAACCGFLLAALVVLPVCAAITGGLSAPHDRYQARIMWLPPFVAVVSLASLRRRRA